MKQQSQVKLEEEYGKGCLLSPLLFNIYAETVMKEALDGLEEGIRVRGELVK